LPEGGVPFRVSGVKGSGMQSRKSAAISFRRLNSFVIVWKCIGIGMVSEAFVKGQNPDDRGEKRQWWGEI